MGIQYHQYDPNITYEPNGNRYGSGYTAFPRLGQGAFRVMVTEAYHRRCAISGEKTLPVLEAAHIQPYSQQGPHNPNNGLLLRQDIHTLFDKGYLTMSEDLHVEVSKRIKEDFGNGREYYSFHGRQLLGCLKICKNGHPRNLSGGIMKTRIWDKLLMGGKKGIHAFTLIRYFQDLSQGAGKYGLSYLQDGI